MTPVLSIRVLCDRISEFTCFVVATGCFPGPPPKRAPEIRPVQLIAKLRACAIHQLHQLASGLLRLRILAGAECIHRDPNQQIRKRLAGRTSMFKRCQSLTGFTCDPSESQPKLRIARPAFNGSSKQALGFVLTLCGNEECGASS